MSSDRKRTGGSLFTSALEQYDVSRVFGNPGTTELPIVDEIARSDLTYELALHEDIAVGMAAGYAQARRYHSHLDDTVLPLGVVNLHIAPGLAHGLGNIHGASFTGAPLLITAGNYETGFQHQEPILHGDLEQMVRSVTKWSAEVPDPDALPTMLRRAVRVALTPPTGPVFLGLPLDVVTAETRASPERLGSIPTLGRGDDAQLEHARSVAVNAQDPVLILGDEVARSGADAIDNAVRFAEAIGARVHGEMFTAEVNYPTDHEQWVSVVPSGASDARAVMQTDTLFFVGCSTHTTAISPDEPIVPRDATSVHISPDPWEIGKNDPADVAIVGDPGVVLGDLADRVAGAIDEMTRQERLDRVRNYELPGSSRSQAPDNETPEISKTELVRAIERAAPDALVVNESVTTTLALRSEWSFEPESLIGNKSGGLGYGLPAAVGVGIADAEAERDRPVVGIIGDGSYLYYPHSIYSAVRSDVDITIVIADNRNYRILKDNMISVLGGTEDEYDFSMMDFDPAVDFLENAGSHGATAKRVEGASNVTSAIQDAINESGPTVLDVPIHD